jgi:hypothetical protein
LGQTSHSWLKLTAFGALMSAIIVKSTFTVEGKSTGHVCALADSLLTNSGVRGPPMDAPMLPCLRAGGVNKRTQGREGDGWLTVRDLESH